MEKIDNDQYRSRVSTAARLLERVADHFRSFGEDRSWGPSGGSVAAEEMKVFAAPHPGYSGAFSSLSVLWDHAHAVADILGLDRVYVWSPMPIGRATLEVGARCWWLSDPEISGLDRVARGYELWRRSFGDLGRLPQFPAEEARELHAQIISQMNDHGVAHDVDDKGFVTNVRDAHWDGARAVLPDVFGDEEKAAGTYMWLSGQSHGDPWAISEGFQRGSDVEPDRRQLNTVSSSRIVGLLTQAMVIAYVNAAGQWSELMGWGDDWEPWRRYYPMRAGEVLDELS